VRIAVFIPSRLPFSVNNYVHYITRELKAFGVQFILFGEHASLPEDVDLLWDPRAAGGAAPYPPLRSFGKPLVVTLHGAAPFSVPARDYYSNLLKAIQGKLYNFIHHYHWHRFNGHYAAIIAVSEYAKGEIISCLRLKKEKVTPIYHGVDLEIFRPSNRITSQNDLYLLHVSQYQPKKNIYRIISGFMRLPSSTSCRLVIIAPGMPERKKIPGIKIIHTPMEHSQLAKIYQKATGFIFPSLHESFGMPILEAMASGCPVVTSNSTACAEVAGSAAISINPRSVDEITDAMQRIMSDENLCESLREKGSARAKRFSWKKSAKRHLQVFESVLNSRKL